MDLNAAIASAMKEATLEQSLRRILKDLPAVTAYHTYDSRRSHSGYPDWTFVGPGGVMWRELKQQAKHPTPAQQHWLDELVAAGQDAGVWRPADLMSGRIARELAALAALPVSSRARAR